LVEGRGYHFVRGLILRFEAWDKKSHPLFCVLKRWIFVPLFILRFGAWDKKIPPFILCFGAWDFCLRPYFAF
ncbi:MAG TPA: hypothetical protein DCE42_27025, partial [Myxococcales bacterium]|nr:hypothetical protein [Myxococcales bacterium]